MNGKILFLISVVITSFLISESYANTLVIDKVTRTQFIKLDEVCVAGPAKLLHNQTHQNGDKIEIWCENAEYRMKIILPNGTIGFVGKCAYTHGQNTIAKVLEGSISVTAPHLVQLQNGRFLIINTTDPRQNATWTNSNITKTHWITNNATAPGTTGVHEQEDWHWTYDRSTHNVIKIETRHNGTWINGNYVVLNQTTVNNDIITLPRSPNQLAFLETPSSGCTDYGFADYLFRTPAPVTGLVDDVPVTLMLSASLDGKTLSLEPVSAKINEPFIFDVDLIGEELNLINYKMLQGPKGMNVDQNNGEINWIPSKGQQGQHQIEIMTDFVGLSPETFSFILNVEQTQEKIAPPYKQFKDGIPIEEIDCSEGLELAIKKSTDMPICVKPLTLEKLLERDFLVLVIL